MSVITELTEQLPRLLEGRVGRPLAEREPAFAPLAVEGREGVEVHFFYSTEQTGPDGPAAALVRYRPGAVTPPHRHTDWELIYVLSGELETDGVAHGPGTVITMEPDTVHSPRSPKGCLLITIWESPVDPM